MTKRQKNNASREPVAFVYDCSKCSKMVVVKADAAVLACPKCGTTDMVFCGNRYAKKAKATKVETRSLLASAYVKTDDCLTHSFDLDAEKFLCRGPKPSNVCDAEAGDASERPTCQKCLQKDPRF